MDYVKNQIQRADGRCSPVGSSTRKKYELYTEPEPAPVGQEKEPPEEVKPDEPRSGGRKRQIKR